MLAVLLATNADSESPVALTVDGIEDEEDDEEEEEEDDDEDEEDDGDMDACCAC